MAVSGEIAVRELSGIIRVLQYEMNNAMSVHPTAKVVCEVNSDFRLHTLADRKKLIHIERQQWQYFYRIYQRCLTQRNKTSFVYSGIITDWKQY